MRHTRRDQYGEISQRALNALQAARNLRMVRGERLADLFARYGDHGSLISGIERQHFPEQDKDWLRTNARLIAASCDEAVQLWRKAGRRLATLYPYQAAARVDGSRY